MTTKEAIAIIRSKNPQYANISDEALLEASFRQDPSRKGKLSDYTEPKKQVAPVAAAAPKPKSLLQKGSDAVSSVMKPASNFMFGTFGKTAGNMIGSVGESINEVFPQKSAKQTISPVIANKLSQQGMSPDQIKEKLTVPVTKTFTNKVDGGTKTSELAFTALELYPGGGALARALKKMPGGESIAQALSHVPAGIRKNAVKQYSEALGATTRELKVKTEKVVPELLDRGVHGSLNKISAMSDNLLDVSGKAVKKAEDGIPVFANSKTNQVAKRASDLKKTFIVNGKVFDQEAVASIDKVVNTITQYGNEIPDAQLIKIRRLLDKSIHTANKNFTKSEGLSLATEAKQGMANTIRGILNTNHPKLGAANKEFNLWSDVNKIVNASLERKSSQSGGITRFIAPMIAGGAGFAGGGSASAIAGYFATQQAIKLFQSTGYKSLSAVNKSRLANYLASGKIKEAMFYTTKLLTVINNENTK